ncbi:hypothetical protein L1887_32300 [Cichorium endivia]|nr:hypothetical protein L1887_32300 [Cichorium endivia]
MKALQGLRSETQQSTKLEKQLDEARAKIEELSAAKAGSEISKFTEDLQKTTAVLNQDMVVRLRTVLQPLINFADRLTRPGHRPEVAQQAGHASSAESIIAPQMEAIYKARRADYALIIKMNNFARDDGKWTEAAIKLFRFQDLNVLNRLPLWSFNTPDSEDIQLDVPFNLKTFSFLQFAQSITKEQSPTYWTNKIHFHAMFIQHQSVVWSANKIKAILSIKEAETYENFKNHEFLVLRGADEVESRFTIADFPIMNPMDFIQLLDLMNRNDTGLAAMSNVAVKNHLLGFLNNFLLRFAKHDLVLSSYYKHTLNTPPVVVRNISRFKNGEILDEPYGVVFKGLRNETEVMIKLRMHFTQRGRLFRIFVMKCSTIRSLQAWNPEAIKQKKNSKSEDFEAAHEVSSNSTIRVA